MANLWVDVLSRGLNVHHSHAILIKHDKAIASVSCLHYDTQQLVSMDTSMHVRGIWQLLSRGSY